VLFLSGHRGLPLQAAAAVLAAVQLGGAASRVLVGVWSDHRRGRLGLMRLIALAGTATFAAVAGLADGPLVLLLPVLFLTGVISMSSNGLAFTATGEIAGLVRSATAMGFQNTVLFVSGTVFPIAFGVAVTIAGWRLSFAALAVLAGLGQGAAVLPYLLAEDEHVLVHERRPQAGHIDGAPDRLDLRHGMTVAWVSYRPVGSLIRTRQEAPDGICIRRANR